MNATASIAACGQPRPPPLHAHLNLPHACMPTLTLTPTLTLILTLILTLTLLHLNALFAGDDG